MSSLDHFDETQWIHLYPYTPLASAMFETESNFLMRQNSMFSKYLTVTMAHIRNYKTGIRGCMELVLMKQMKVITIYILGHSLCWQLSLLSLLGQMGIAPMFPCTRTAKLIKKLEFQGLHTYSKHIWICMEWNFHL